MVLQGGAGVIFACIRYIRMGFSASRYNVGVKPIMPDASGMKKKGTNPSPPPHFFCVSKLVVYNANDQLQQAQTVLRVTGTLNRIPDAEGDSHTQS
jgi:hypothetical protein